MSIEVVVVVAELARRIEFHDRDLARQVRRSMNSVPANLAEGAGGSGGTRRQRYKDALGSCIETIAHLECARACGYVAVDSVSADKLQRIKATLTKILYM